MRQESLTCKMQVSKCITAYYDPLCWWNEIADLKEAQLKKTAEAKQQDIERKKDLVWTKFQEDLTKMEKSMEKKMAERLLEREKENEVLKLEEQRRRKLAPF